MVLAALGSRMTNRLWVYEDGFNTEEGSHRHSWSDFSFRGRRAGSYSDPTSFCLPPGVYNVTTFLTNHIIVPFPGLVVQRLTNWKDREEIL